jgi:hypothetical protein
MEPPIEHRDVTTIMMLLATSTPKCGRSASCWRTKMGKKRKRPKTTPEEEARFEETQRMVRERIAYHEAKAREEDERRAQQTS